MTKATKGKGAPNTDIKRKPRRRNLQITLTSDNPAPVPKGRYMVLAEYCRKHKLNYANTRNHLLSGKLQRPYIHVGRLWLIKY